MNLKLTAMAAFAALTVASSAHAALRLDQTSLPATGAPPIYSEFGVGPGFAFGQTFVAGLTGTLQSIDLAMYGNAVEPGADTSVLVFIEDSAGKALFGRNYKYDELPTEANFSWNNLFNIGVGMAVTAGETYKLIVAPSDFVGYKLLAPTAYAAGDSIFRGSAGGDLGMDMDMAFRTYVDDGVAAVPEPATWAMMIMGFGASGALLRRRRMAQLAA